MIEFDTLVREAAEYLEKNRHCKKHHLEHTGSNTYALDFYSHLGEIEKGKELLKYLISKIVPDGESKVFYPGRLNQMNMSNNIIDSGSAVDTISRFLKKHRESFSEEEHARFGTAIEEVVRCYLTDAAGAEGKVITNQRLWGLTGVASFAAYKDTHEFDGLIKQSIERAFTDMTVDGFFRYYPDAPKHGAFSGYDGITTFYQSRCIAFIRYSLEMTGIDATPYEERLQQSERALLSMYTAEGYKDLRLECKRWYWLTPYEVASHGFDGFALANARCDLGSVRSHLAEDALHNVFYQVRDHFYDGYLHAAKGPAINFQCPIFWTAHLAWLTRMPNIRERFNSASELKPFTYQFLGKEVVTNTAPGKRFLIDARWQERNPTVGIYDNGLREKNDVRWHLTFPKMPPAYLFSLRENLNHTWYAFRGGYVYEAYVRKIRFARESIVMLLPRYALRYGRITKLSHTVQIVDGKEQVNISVVVSPASKYGTVRNEEQKLSYIL